MKFSDRTRKRRPFNTEVIILEYKLLTGVGNCLYGQV